MKNENWKAIAGYEGLYEVSDMGRVKSLNYNHTGKEKILKLKKSHCGYLNVNICKDGHAKSVRIHRLVATAFISNPHNLETINHKDEDKTNNSVENLEWCTRGYNNTYNNKAIKIGLKLRNNERSRALIALDENNNIIYEFPSVREAARFLNKPKADSNIHSGIRKNQKRYGYYWKFKD